MVESLKEKTLSSHRNGTLQELSTKLTSFLEKKGIAESASSVKDMWKLRHKETVARCFHKIGIVVPYDKNTELGYRPLTMSDRKSDHTLMESSVTIQELILSCKMYFKS